MLFCYSKFESFCIFPFIDMTVCEAGISKYSGALSMLMIKSKINAINQSIHLQALYEFLQFILKIIRHFFWMYVISVFCVNVSVFLSVCVCLCVCVSIPMLLMTSGMVWTTLCAQTCKNQSCKCKLHQVIFLLLSSVQNVVIHFHNM